MFAQLAESVARQTLAPECWLVQWDYRQRGKVSILNELADCVDTEWLYRADDDEILELDHFDTLRPYMTDNVDIVYSWCRSEGPISTDHFHQSFSAEKLQRRKYVPSAACIRKSLWDKLGGYNDVEDEEHDFWKRALDAGAKFECVPIVTWRYRVGSWKT